MGQESYLSQWRTGLTWGDAGEQVNGKGAGRKNEKGAADWEGYKFVRVCGVRERPGAWRGMGGESEGGRMRDTHGSQ